MMMKVIAIFDDGGGLTLQLGDDFAHYYDDMKQAAADYQEYANSGTTDGWDGHEPQFLNEEISDDEVRNGGVRVMDADDISEAVANPSFETGWQNIREFIEALR